MKSPLPLPRRVGHCVQAGFLLTKRDLADIGGLPKVEVFAFLGGGGGIRSTKQTNHTSNSACFLCKNVGVINEKSLFLLRKQLIFEESLINQC